ncbi:putative neutral sphingomyelinase [Branchiostoma floridae]|uniref:sphingomyelin phosphodiesterase n=1 Tax=Branchiostoma floridae TaxID=7739 RepID=A0A9J7N3B9_BRAFL|nr:putative neutral sphingomyelinase [Branchiostoma floridae]
MPSQLRVLTLNCWGVPGCPKMPERFQAIGEELSTGKYDLVSLQEVFTQGMFRKVVSLVNNVLPYHHYFYSGYTGSGVCVLSKHPITAVCQHQYTLNGHPQDGLKLELDWFGGKLLGLCRIQYSGKEINFYATHTHAAHKSPPELSPYKAHRVSQAFEISQFIRSTGGTADLNILTGDLNFRPGELGLKIIQSDTGMEDAWLTAEHKNADDSGVTGNHPENNFATGNQQRIDYILYKGSTECKVKCVHCETTMHKVPGKPFNYSDHEAVLAHFELETVSGPSDAPVNPPDLSERDASLRQAVQILEEKLASSASSRLFYVAVLLLSLLLMFSTSWFQLHHLLTSLLHLLLGILISWSFWMGVVVVNTEERGLLATKAGIEILLNGSGKKCD